MIGYNTNDDRYQLLRNFKETLVGMANERSLRSVIRRNLSAGAGPFLVDIRKRLFDDLMELQRKTGWSLITEEEIVCIRQHWEEDETIHNVGDPQRPLLWDLIATK
jgi:hypothetical protein